MKVSARAPWPYHATDPHHEPCTLSAGWIAYCCNYPQMFMRRAAPCAVSLPLPLTPSASPPAAARCRTTRQLVRHPCRTRRPSWRGPRSGCRLHVCMQTHVEGRTGRLKRALQALHLGRCHTGVFGLSSRLSVTLATAPASGQRCCTVTASGRPRGTSVGPSPFARSGQRALLARLRCPDFFLFFSPDSPCLSLFGTAPTVQREVAHHDGVRYGDDGWDAPRAGVRINRLHARLPYRDRKGSTCKATERWVMFMYPDHVHAATTHATQRHVHTATPQGPYATPPWPPLLHSPLPNPRPTPVVVPVGWAPTQGHVRPVHRRLPPPPFFAAHRVHGGLRRVAGCGGHARELQVPAQHNLISTHSQEEPTGDC